MSSKRSGPGFLWRWYEEGSGLSSKPTSRECTGSGSRASRESRRERRSSSLSRTMRPTWTGSSSGPTSASPSGSSSTSAAPRRRPPPPLNNTPPPPPDFINPYALKDVVHMVEEGLPLLVFPREQDIDRSHNEDLRRDRLCRFSDGGSHPSCSTRGIRTTRSSHGSTRGDACSRPSP